MKEYVIEYHFGDKDVIKRYVPSESNDLKTVLESNTPAGEVLSYMDPIDGNFYSFNISQVKYTKVYSNM